MNTSTARGGSRPTPPSRTNLNDIDVDIDGSVQLWLDSELGPRWRSGEFNVNVIKALGIDQLLPKRVKKLSGGERQAVSIAVCLGRDADLYLLDEPSAHLDANARMEAAKAIRRTMEANEKSAFVIDHDVYFIDIVSDSLLVFEGQGGVEGRHGSVSIEGRYESVFGGR